MRGAEVRDHVEAERLAERPDAARLRDPAEPVHVRLQHVDRAGLDEVAEAVARRLVLAGGDRGRDSGADPRQPGDVVGDRPAPRASAGADRRPRSRGCSGSRSRRPSSCTRRPSRRRRGRPRRPPYGRARRSADPARPSSGPYGRRCLTALNPCSDPERGLGGERVEVLASRRASSRRPAARPQPAAEQRRRPGRRAASEQVPERDVDCADRVEHDAAPADVQRRAVHRLPRERDLGRRAARHERLELADELDRSRVAEAGRADADAARLVLELDDDEPRPTRAEGPHWTRRAGRRCPRAPSAASRQTARCPFASGRGLGATVETCMPDDGRSSRVVGGAAGSDDRNRWSDKSNRARGSRGPAA